jgi:hypothetical protein
MSDHNVTRRDFIKTAAPGVAAATMVSVVEHLEPADSDPVTAVRFDEKMREIVA